MTPRTHVAAETVAALALTGVLAKLLPAIASLLAIVWYCVVLWECPVGKRWRLRWRNLYFGALAGSLTVENKLMLLLLLLGGGGMAMALYAISELTR
jgi:hypothetical protein